MHKIKFRAWNKQKKFMLDIFDCDHKDWFLPSWKDEWEVMQYTGLNDKNGKEIYAGDKVDCCMIGLRSTAKNEIGTVQFADGCFEVLFEDGLRQYLKCFVANHVIKVI